MRVLVFMLITALGAQSALASERSQSSLSEARAEAASAALGQTVNTQPRPQNDSGRDQNRRVEVQLTQN